MPCCIWYGARPRPGSTRGWRRARASQLHRVAPDFAERFPHSTWLAQQGSARTVKDPETYLADQADQAYRAAIELLLDGIQTQLRTPRA